MPNIRIKEVNDTVACSGLFMGGNSRLRRKLLPGEIVYIADDELFRVLQDSNAIELTTKKPTRPLEFESEREARLCSPNFKPVDSGEENDVLQARADVAKRLQREFGKPEDHKELLEKDREQVAANEAVTQPKINRRVARKKLLAAKKNDDQKIAG